MNKISQISPCQRVQLARHIKRPGVIDYISMLLTDFVQLHGDRLFGDDPAIIAGIGRFEQESVIVIGHQKGHDVKTNIKCNFGMSHPEGYRKALRIGKLAERFKKPIITFIDTPGAYPGIGAEERGQAEAIARNLLEFSQLKTPIIVIIIGEGGSGGALAIGIGDRVLMLENAVYSVISPEGCASILWKDKSKVEEAASTLRLTAPDLLELKIIDEIIPEPSGGAHLNYKEAAQNLNVAIRQHLFEIKAEKLSVLISKRYKRIREIGESKG